MNFINKYLSGWLLLIAAFLGFFIVFIPGLIYGFIKCFWKHHIGIAFENLNMKLRKLSTGFDKYGNVACEELLSDTCVKKSKWPFGFIEQSISMVLGHNEIDGTLSKTGNVIVKGLSKIEKDHCKKWALKDKFKID